MKNRFNQLTQRKFLIAIIILLILVLAGGIVFVMASGSKRTLPPPPDYSGLLTADTKAAIAAHRGIITNSELAVGRAFSTGDFAKATVKYQAISPEKLLEGLQQSDYRNLFKSQVTGTFTVEITQAGMVKLLGNPNVLRITVNALPK